MKQEKNIGQGKNYKSRASLYEGKTQQEILILKQKFAARQKRYRERHKEHDFEYHKKYREKNRQKIYEAVKKYRSKHQTQPKQHLEGTYYSRNKEKILKKYKENKEKALAYAKEYYAKKKSQVKNNIK